MTIDKKLITKWKALRSSEDSGKMVTMLEGSYPELFSRAFRLGRCSDEVFKVMADFYEQKARLIKEYL